MRFFAVLTIFSALAALAPAAADTLEFADGRILNNCFIRDEGVRILVWENMSEVGGPAKPYPRSQVKSYKIERDASWDEHPNLPDLSVTFIEMNPKLAGLHGSVDYDKWGRPILRARSFDKPTGIRKPKHPGGAALLDLGPKTAMQPEAAAKRLKLSYKPGEPITLTAHVRNVGFADAGPFDYAWLIDGKTVRRGRCTRSLKELEETTFQLKWRWQPGFHCATFRITSPQKEIATINNETRDPLWGFGLVFIVNHGRVKAWHHNRTAYGTFCFEDYYRWHIDIMNRLFAASVFPSSPNGIKARVRLDRIVYTDDVDKASAQRVSPNGIIYDQGAWIWTDSPEEKKNGWQPPTKEWRNQTEWSLPHELGHQLGLTDWYVLDYPGDEGHLMPDNGDKIAHFMTHPMQMMHWHGPHIHGEVDAAYLNMTWNKPRGYFGDYYFAIPRECFLRIVDVNGLPVQGAKVEIFQRGTAVDPKGKPSADHGVLYYPVIEDGNFDRPVSKLPVIVGTTDRNGILRLPNRPVKEVKTLNGFHRRPNPFGNINVVGQRGLMLVRVTKHNRPCFFWLEIYDFNVAWFRGHKDRFTITLKTPYGSASSPLPPRNVRVERLDDRRVRVSWDAPAVPREQHYLDRPIGYRVYRRISSDGLNDRPWFPVATVNPNIRECVIDLADTRVEDIYWFSQTNRFAVSTVGECSVESELVETVLTNKRF